MKPEDRNHNFLTTNRFYVEIDSTLKASFSECSGLDVQIDKETYFEGGVNEQQRIFLKQTKFGDITLKRGMSDDQLFWDWINQVIEHGKAKRCDLNILTFNQAGETMQCWTLLAAVPIAWKTPGLRADSSAVAIEELTLAFEGLKVMKNDKSERVSPSLSRSQSGYFESPAKR
ncbi:phage tail protein [cf. Phormidesmis sp. LEGE 11477]|nr:phage tail protein [cf. Phormidesmis sp. LEGE 11477]